ncbi:ABC transporter permease [Microvirga sp. TS319]|uniref:ABC transporter permease n=1 Tax=Microvirga sp. TS319 TaxID=3241165 RepID=UPI00351A5E04
MPTGLLSRLLSLLLLLLLWQTVTSMAGSGEVPSPAGVFAFVVEEARSGDLARNLTATLRRVLISFSLAMVIGGAIGLALGRSPRCDRIVDSWLMILLNTPALVIIILCYVWLGLSETAAIAAVTLNKIPNVAVIMREGARSLDPQIEEMRKAFRFDRLTWIRHVLLPQVEPYAIAAARSGLALVWKIVLVVELLGRPDGVGYALSYYFQLFNVAALLGYSLVFTAVVLVIDSVVLQPLEVYARRWRPVPSAA